LSRGDRANERTAEERERDRLERARRRAEREGRAVPPAERFEMPPAESLPGDPSEAQPKPGGPLAAGEPLVPMPGSEPPEASPPDAESQPDVEQPDAPPPPTEPDSRLEAAESHVHSEPAAAGPEPAAGLDPVADLDPAADTEPATDFEPSVFDVVPSAERPETPATDAPATDAPHLEPTAAELLAADLPIGELPAVEPEQLPAEPRPEGKRSSRERRAGRDRRGEASASAAASAPPLRPSAGAPAGKGASRAAGGRPPSTHRGRRSPTARLLAIVGLAAVVVVVVVLLIALHGSGTKKQAPAVAPVVKVLIPEGETRIQIALIAKAKHLTGSYRSAAHSSSLLDPTQYGASASTPDLEGFLFPATYDMNPGAPASELVEKQLTAFKEHFGLTQVERAHALKVTPYGLLTVASMIEREAQVPGDRAKIAAVIYNRLNAGIPLGIDATIYYAVEAQKNVPTYTRELTATDLQIDSPYNTRLHTGLPPTPISNPGVASIEAAAHPAHASYLYYVAGADGCGEQVFSTTQSAFESDVAAYEAAKQRNGGKPPKCKKG
jgi:UPF0755 protein